MDSGSFISLATSATALARIKGVELEQEQKHPLHVTNIQRWLWSYRSVPNKNSKNATCISKLPTPKILKKYLAPTVFEKSAKSLIASVASWMSAVCLHLQKVFKLKIIWIFAPNYKPQKSSKNILWPQCLKNQQKGLILQQCKQSEQCQLFIYTYDTSISCLFTLKIEKYELSRQKWARFARNVVKNEILWLIFQHCERTNLHLFPNIGFMRWIPMVR